MSNFIKNFLEKDRHITVFDVLITIFGFTIIRTFLENFSNPEPLGGFTQPFSIFFEFFLFYLSTFLFLLIILSYFTKLPLKNTTGILLSFFPIICIPPVIDLMITHGKGYCITYIIQAPVNLLTDFLTFFGHFSGCGLTPGIRIEISIICIIAFVLIFHTTKNLVRSLLGTIATYIVIFFNVSFPSLIMAPFYIFNPSIDKTFFFDKLFKTSLLNSIHTFGPIPNNPYAFLGQQSSIFSARFFWILIIIELLIIFYVNYRSIWNAWIKNLRPERVLYYFYIAILGIFISKKVNGFMPNITLPDVFSFIIFFALIALSWWLAVIVNDLEDIEIDKISNKERPLVTNEISIDQFKTIGFIILTLILIGAPLINYHVFVFLILFQIVYYFYSKNPLRLKRWFFIASPMVAFNALLIAMAGFFLVSANQNFLAFPPEYLWFILIGFSIFINIKDFKDTEGDKREGIKTLPVIFGQEKAKKILTLLVVAFLLIFSFYKQNDYLLFFSIFFSALFYLFMRKKIFKEVYFFCLLFLYLIIIIIAL